MKRNTVSQRKMPKYDFYQDGGHGWIKVSMKELVELKIPKLISNSSHMKGDFAYLEEDGDLNLFFEAKGLVVGEYKFEDICKTHTSEQSKIRHYHRYDYEHYVALRKMIKQYNSNPIVRKWINKTLDNKSKCEYFSSKKSYDKLSSNARSWFYNIAKTYKKDILKTLQESLTNFKKEVGDADIPSLNEKIHEMEEELKFLSLESK